MNIANEKRNCDMKKLLAVIILVIILASPFVALAICLGSPWWQVPLVLGIALGLALMVAIADALWDS